MEHKVYIQNLKCGGCANTIVSRLSKLEGITNVSVSNDDDSVSFNFLKEENIREVSLLLSKLGYPIVGDSNSIGKQAKSFVSCAIGRINK